MLHKLRTILLGLILGGIGLSFLSSIAQDTGALQRAERHDFSRQHVFTPVIQHVLSLRNVSPRDCDTTMAAFAQQCGTASLGMIGLHTLIDAALRESGLVTSQGSWEYAETRDAFTSRYIMHNEPFVITKWYQADDARLDVTLRYRGYGHYIFTFLEQDAP